MKKVLVPLIAIFALSFTANAQEKVGEKGHHHHHHGHHHKKGMMAKQLNFSEEQKSRAKAINEDFRKNMQELNKNESITVKEQRDRKVAIQKERKTKMDGLLTAEQKTKMAQLKTEQKAKNEERYAKHLDKMKTNLNLSDEQVSKLKAQRLNTQAKAEKIKKNESLSREQKKEQMMALRTETKDQNKKIFTPEQLKKREDMKKNYAGKLEAK
jgi:Spy/CpxP family protein refolding chaperone